ncbi:MAG: protein kinase [Kofleriaceae bacterium]
MGKPSTQTTSLVGSLLGKDYLVLEQIGMGGMAVVYLVEHQKLLKRFAAKVLSPEHATSAEARARFTQEAHAASQLDHENIVSISDFGTTADGRPFFVMELLRGKPLDVRLAEGPMSLEEVVAVSVPVARALAHAHAEGIIHRDVKPENVFLVQRSQGRWSVKVLDFGIAKVPVNQHLTAMGQALGSPMFMSPEACRGDEVDPRADIYSFGILLYMMLVGHVPFADHSLLKVLQMQVSSPLPAPREFKPELSPQIEAVVVRALEKNPDDRYANMEEMLFDLEAALPEGADSLLILAQFGTPSVHTPFPGTQSQRMARVSQMNVTANQTGSRAARLPAAPTPRGRGGWIAFATLALLLVAGAAGYWWWQQRQGVEVASRGQPVPALQAAAAAPVTTPERRAPSEPVIERAVEPEPVIVDPEPAIAEPARIEPRVTSRPLAKSVVKAAKRAPAPVTVTRPAKAPTAEAPTKVAQAGSTEVARIESAPVPPPAPAVDKPRVEPAKPAPEVVPPKPASPAAKPVSSVGSLDATPQIARLDVQGALPSSVVRRAVERALPAMRTCYRAAAKAGQSTPSVTVSLSFEVDESSAATNVSASGASFGSLAACMRGAVGRVQTQQAPDVGIVYVVAAITFRPT